MAGSIPKTSPNIPTPPPMPGSKPHSVTNDKPGQGQTYDSSGNSIKQSEGNNASLTGQSSAEEGNLRQLSTDLGFQSKKEEIINNLVASKIKNSSVQF